ncbi:unnamed protein product [Pleuronectes platessa]|uniref:Uncharacterized protein n=1 Tax=Pleuronectes platessa TaxID=8262 RepID=A0A9N7VRM8_PLEPL|nr:unnamed protein product [Pleuronectes platessa]
MSDDPVSLAAIFHLGTSGDYHHSSEEDNVQEPEASRGQKTPLYRERSTRRHKLNLSVRERLNVGKPPRHPHSSNIKKPDPLWTRVIMERWLLGLGDAAENQATENRPENKVCCRAPCITAEIHPIATNCWQPVNLLDWDQLGGAHSSKINGLDGHHGSKTKTRKSPKRIC